MFGFIKKILIFSGIFTTSYSISNPVFSVRPYGGSYWFVCRFFLVCLSFRRFNFILLNRYYKKIPSHLHFLLYQSHLRFIFGWIAFLNEEDKFKRNLDLYFLSEFNFHLSKEMFEKLNFSYCGKDVVVSFDDSGYGGYGHLLIEYFPLFIFISKKNNVVFNLSVLEDSFSRLFVSFANLYGIRYDFFGSFVDSKPIKKNTIEHLFDLVVNDRLYHYPHYLGIRLMRHNHNAILCSNHKPKFIWVTRSYNDSTGRVLVNEDSLVKELKKIGFIVVSPEKFLFAEQLAIFASAKVVAGVSGSALLNALFLPKDATLIEISPRSDFRHGPLLISLASGFNYLPFFGDQIGDDMVEFKPAYFIVDQKPIIKSITSLVYESC